MSAMRPLILASASPARRRLLESAGLTPIILVSDFDESSIIENDPEQLVRVLAQKKAEAVISKLPGAIQGKQISIPGEILVLACDSVLALGGQIHGKPRDANDAIGRWKMMRNETGDLWTGHALYLLELSSTSARILKSSVQAPRTKVHFANPSDSEIQAYVRTGEPLNCAGAFALEGRGGLLVRGLDGCHSNVIGLSLPVLREMMIEMGSEVFV
ncbi:MAG: septum formation inhibitor Maf [Leptospirales bacterium]|nr:septum formation inhibitor Maf [Leptospirales bacterium]